MTTDALVQPFLDLVGFIFPFSFAEPDFMRRALLAMLLTAPMAAMAGVPVVQARMAFFSDAIGHSAFTGVALGVALGIDPSLTMLLFGLLVAASIAMVKERTGLSPDTVIGVFFSFVIALGIAVISARKGLGRNLSSFLFGDPLAASSTDLVAAAMLFVVVVAYLAWGWNRLLLLSIHEGVARTRGVRARLVEVSFALVVALAVTAAIRTVGILLVTALLVVPAAAARNVARTSAGALVVAVVVALLSSVGGLALSYHLDTAAGASVVLCAIALFVVTLVGPKRSGS